MSVVDGSRSRELGVPVPSPPLGGAQAARAAGERANRMGVGREASQVNPYNQGNWQDILQIFHVINSWAAKGTVVFVGFKQSPNMEVKNGNNEYIWNEITKVLRFGVYRSADCTSSNGWRLDHG